MSESMRIPESPQDAAPYFSAHQPQQGAKLIFVEDDPFLRAEISEYLESRGHNVTQADSLAAFRMLFVPNKYQIAIVDIGLPDGLGSELASELGKASIPGVIFFTARCSVADRIACLRMGADYYLTKPASLDELSAVIEMLLRRRCGAVSADESAGTWVLDAARWILSTPAFIPLGPSIRLSAQDFLILKTLVKHCKQPVTRRQLVAALGKNYLDYDQRRLDTQMRRLRRKVLAVSGLELPIRTIHAVGYMFSAEAELRH